MINNKFIAELRSFMHSGKEHPACENCYKLESLWVKSPRNMYNDEYISKHSSFPWKPSKHPKLLFFSFSNLCNFACRMCRSRTSTGRQKLDLELYWKNMWLREFPSKIINDFKSHTFLKDLNEIDIKGWEPLLHKDYYEYLDYLIQNGYASKLTLTHNSNLSVLPWIDNKYVSLLPKWYNNLFDLWKHFKQVNMRVSIEWYWKDSDYIRIWWEWENTVKNIRTLKEKTYVNLSFSTTIQIDNIMSIPKLVLFSIQENIPLGINSHGFVQRPHYYNIRILPSVTKRYIRLFYLKFLEKSDIPSNYRKDLEAILTYMESWKEDHELLKEYIRVTKITNKLYNYEFSKIYKLINAYIYG